MGFWLASSTREVATLLPGRRCTSEETAKKDGENVPRKIQEERASVRESSRTQWRGPVQKPQTAAKIDRRRGGKAGEGEAKAKYAHNDGPN